MATTYTLLRPDIDTNNGTPQVSVSAQVTDSASGGQAVVHRPNITLTPGAQTQVNVLVSAALTYLTQ